MRHNAVKVARRAAICSSMRALVPLELHEVLKDQVVALMESCLRVGEYDPMLVSRLLRETERLQSVDVVEANVLQAFLFSITGQEVKRKAALLNATRNFGEAEVFASEFQHAVNHLHGEDASAFLGRCLEKRGSWSFNNLAIGALASGLFRQVRDYVEVSRAKGEVLQVEPGLLARIRRAAEVLDAADVPDQVIRRTIDTAGIVVRRHRLLWRGDMPDLHVLDQTQGGPLVALAYHFPVTPEEASEMTWAYLELMLEHGQDTSAFQVWFVGADLTQGQSLQAQELQPA